MTSERKIVANRRNSAKSSGPRTAAGKKTASRNALRHGLAAIPYEFSFFIIDHFAHTICGDDAGLPLLAQARVIVENELALTMIQKHEIEVVERLREKTAVALVKRDIGVKLAKLSLRKSRDARNELRTELRKMLKKYKDQLPKNTRAGRWPLPVPSEFGALLQDEDDPLDPTEQPIDPAEREGATPAATLRDGGVGKRDEAEALEEAARDLIRLDRYHRRAWSRQKRALRNFINIKLMRRLGGLVNAQPSPD